MVVAAMSQTNTTGRTASTTPSGATWTRDTHASAPGKKSSWSEPKQGRQDDLRGADKRMLDTTGEEDGHAVGVDAPHQRADPQRRSLRRDDL